ncbi:MAG: ABC transporter permease [Bacteroidetes bacterium RIFCSPHIGHO2_02_FULL_44_7]|nr:MAG: ABC transporter permease [Bacteroidetes bacterium RIFCSPHIGHO2_02_FULL_44_7]
MIRPKKSLFSINIREIWTNRDLLLLFVKRDFIAVYKQTILGPLWFFIEPALTTLVFTIIFGQIAGITTGSIPPIAFYLAGLTIWNYFSECFKKTSNTFIENQDIFGKVYFPRLITPLAIVLSSLIKFTVQFILFLGVYCYYLVFTDAHIGPQPVLLLLPLLILLVGCMGLGLGMIISSLTTKYRDMRFLIQFGIQLWLYASPIIYPLSATEGKLRTVLMLNPMTAILETFKFGFFGEGTLDWVLLGYSTGFTFFILILGILVYNRTEQNFMDTV